jgi:hypothetical protein
MARWSWNFSPKRFSKSQVLDNKKSQTNSRSFRPVNGDGFARMSINAIDSSSGAAQVLKCESFDFHALNSIPSTISWHRNETFRFQSVPCAHLDPVAIILWRRSFTASNLLRPADIIWPWMTMLSYLSWHGMTWHDMTSRERHTKHCHNSRRCSWTLSGPL